MVRFEWNIDRQSRCPSCREKRRGKKHLLDILIDADTQRALGAERIRLLHCTTCGARYSDPLRGADYTTGSKHALRLYLEQGAGVDVMLEPLSLVDGRPIRRYLEIGCSFGFAMDYARRILGWEVRGFDPGQIAAAGKEQLRLPIENTYFDTADNIGAGEADLIMCSEVIEHIVAPNQFVALLRHALGDTGLLILTTPNGDALSPDAADEAVLTILSPGHHVILYNDNSITSLLRRNGFAHVKVVDRGNQLHIAASAAPFSGRSSCFTRDLYRRFLELSLEEHGIPHPLGLGYAYRLFKEHMNAARYHEAREVLPRLRDHLDQYGIDIDALAISVPQLSSDMEFEEFGERWPYNICGICHYLGLLKLNDEQSPQLAAPLFRSASVLGTALRRSLNAIGADDLETESLCREADIARLAALARSNPPLALEALQEIAQNPAGLDLPHFETHLIRACEQLRTDLINLGEDLRRIRWPTGIPLRGRTQFRQGAAKPSTAKLCNH